MIGRPAKTFPAWPDGDDADPFPVDDSGLPLNRTEGQRAIATIARDVALAADKLGTLRESALAVRGRSDAGEVLVSLRELESRIWDVAEAHNLCQGPEDEAKISEIVRDATYPPMNNDFVVEPGLNRRAPLPSAERNLKFTPFAEIRLSTSPRYLIKGVIPRVGLAVVWGEPKCGKSFKVFDMTAHIAAGRPYRGRRVKQAPVVYFALEGQDGFTARAEAFRRAHDVVDLPFYLSADRISLPRDGPLVVSSIQRQFPGVKPGVVVLDTLNRSIDGSENDPADMGSYVRTADLIRETFGCVVIVIHHCGVAGERPRGHTSLTGAADAQLAVKRDSAGNIVLKIEEMKDGTTGDEIISCLECVTVGTDDDGDEITSCIVRPASGATEAVRPTQKLTPTSKKFRDALVNVLAGDSAAKLPNGRRAASTEDWKRECTHLGLIDAEAKPASARAQFSRARRDLVTANSIACDGDFSWVL